MYQMNEKVRYSEVEADCFMSWDALLNYYQDCSVSQSEALGIGVQYLSEHHLAWLLSSWQIRVEQMPKLEEEIVVGTWAYGFKGFYGYRNFTLDGKNKVRYSYANSIWVLVDTKTGRPVKIPQDMLDTYPFEPQLQMECKERKIAIPKEYRLESPVKVQRFFIDTNHHMNNEKYVMIAQEYLPDSFVIKELRVEYKKAAMLDDVIYPQVSFADGTCTVVLADSEGRVYAVVMFISQ